MDVRTTSSEGSTVMGPGRLPDEREELSWAFSSLSHELCRPLTSLKAGFDLLLSEPAARFTPDQRSHLATMVALCDDMLQLAHSYLDYAGIVQGSRPATLGTYTIGALIHEIERQFAPFAAARTISWETHLEGADTHVVTDASRFQQIMGNLVSNALKYTPMGGRVRATGTSGSDSWTVSVTDTGPGIPPEALELVFQPFYRLARDEHSSVEGNGLGLAICRELVTQLEGRIEMSSVVGGGTCVTIEFPLRVREAPGL